MSRDPTRNVRVSDELWTAAMNQAEAEGRSLSSLIRQWLIAYVDYGWRPKMSADERRRVVKAITEALGYAD